MENPNVIEINTPDGVIKAHLSTNPDYPGLYVSVNNVSLVSVEYDTANEHHAVRVWPHKDPDNDPDYHQSLPKGFENLTFT